MKVQKKFSYILLFVVIISSASFTSSSMSYFGGWTKLGKQVVSEGANYDTLEIEGEQKNIKRLKLKISKKSVYLRSIKIIYEDNTSENHIISRNLEKGDATRTFDLIGHHRIVKKILFLYRSANKGGAQIVVMVKQ